MTAFGINPVPALPDAKDKAAATLRGLEDRQSAASLAVALVEMLIILATALAADGLYHRLALGEPFSDLALSNGVVAGLVFIVIQAASGEYKVARVLSRKAGRTHLLRDWTCAVALVVVISFLSKTSEDISRGALITLAISGLVTLALFRRAQSVIWQQAVKTLRYDARRVALVGFREDIDRYYRTHRLWDRGIRVAGTANLETGDDSIAAELWIAGPQRRQTHATLDSLSTALRGLGVDDIALILPWSAQDKIETTLNALAVLPVSLYLSPDPAFRHLERSVLGQTSLSQALTDMDSGLTGIRISRRPIPPLSRLAKRAFDIAVSGAALVVLSPLLMLIALAIRLESPGSPIFCQQRNGFNEQPFTIYKFRSMRTSSGGGFQQTRKDDNRITRIGAFLRRSNLDELPQLINVFLGDMSLVGPRPHAVEHNHAFMTLIANYAYRHHVKPGITGWAQVNGWRGAAEDHEHMSMRVAHDLDYINNWSLWTDIVIIWKTVFSRKAFRNAF